jgi:glycosyltransferase involved in cell wall biosynthesis
MKLVFVSHRPFGSFLSNGFRQRVGRILYHFIRSEEVSDLIYVWWNNEPLSGLSETTNMPDDFKEVLLCESRRLQLPFARTLGLQIGLLNQYRIKRLAKKLREMADGVTWVWATDPRFCDSMWKLADRLGGRLAYDLIDNFAVMEALSQRDRERFRLGYENVMLLADRIFANNPDIGDFFQAPKEKFHYIGNGVDLETFHTARETQDPVDMQDIGHPRVGFIGVLSSITNVHLLNRVAREIPTCEVVYVGPQGDFDTSLDKRIHCLGRKPYQEIPRYVASIDVGLSVYRKCSATKYNDPQKLYEYLSVGCPVVATNAQDYARISPYVQIASTGDEFVQLVRKVIAEPDSIMMREARIQSVSSADWKCRVEEILNSLSGE